MAGTSVRTPPPLPGASWGSIAEPFGNGFRSELELDVPRREVYRLLAKLHRKRLAAIARRTPTEPPRERERVADIYAREYAPSTSEFVRKRAARRDLFLVSGRPVFVDGWFTYQYRADLLERALSLIGARTVLEVGSGRGILPAMLALRLPQLELSGIDLAPEGVARSTELAQAPPPELLRLCGAAQLSPEQEKALARLRFTAGDASELPFADGSFDVSYTCLSLEQMPRLAPSVLAEMARVTRRYCVFLEPFADANGPLGRAQLRVLDYFRSDVASMRDHGLEPVYYTRSIPQKVRFNTGLVVAEVMGR